MVYLSRIYTKTGDTGETGLGDGHRVAKDHPRVEAYGQVDELNAVLGLLTAYCPDSPERDMIRTIQNDLFDLGADLCIPSSENETPGSVLRVTPAQYERLEHAIDRLNENLDPLRSFILPGGTPAAAWLHMARTVCRRAERTVVTFMHTEPINPPHPHLPQPPLRFPVCTRPHRQQQRPRRRAMGTRQEPVRKQNQLGVATILGAS